MLNTGPEVIILFSCSTQLGMNFFLLINVIADGVLIY